MSECRTCLRNCIWKGLTLQGFTALQQPSRRSGITVRAVHSAGQASQQEAHCPEMAFTHSVATPMFLLLFVREVVSPPTSTIALAGEHSWVFVGPATANMEVHQISFVYLALTMAWDMRQSCADVKLHFIVVYETKASVQTSSFCRGMQHNTCASQ